MTSYCALLRGISPGRPGNDALRGTFENLGFTQVSTLLSSGNVFFRTDSTDPTPVLEERIQQALRQDCGIGGGTMLRTRQQIQDLMDRQPFGELSHGKETYLTLTFFKEPLDSAAHDLPAEPIPHVRLLGYEAASQALLAVVDQTRAKTPDYMAWLQRRYGAEITTRTWNTVTRILTKLS